VKTGLLFLFCQLLFNTTAFADYRVFKLQITNNKTKQARTFQSTLDPDQYRSIYGLKNEESITYVQTWRCWGRTDFFKPHCQSPDVKPVVVENTK